MASSLELDIVVLKATTVGSAGVFIFNSAVWPSGTTYRATVAAHEVTLGSNNNYRHWELLGTYYLTSEASKDFTSTSIAEAGSGGSAEWTATFVNNNNFPALELVGVVGVDVSWKVVFQTIKVR